MLHLGTLQVQRLLLHVPWLHRRKRDCTPALFLDVFINIVAVFFGGGRIGTSPFLLTMSRRSPEEEGLALLLILPVCTSEGEGQAFSLTTSVTTSETGPPPHNVGKFHRGAVLTQMGRPGDTMICEKATFCTRVQVRTDRDASAIPCGGCVEQSCHAGLGCHGWDASAIPSGRNGAAAQMGRSGDTMVCGLACVLHTGAGQCRSGRFGDTIGHNTSVGAVAQMGRYGDTMVCGMAYDLHWCRSVPLGTLCDTTRWCAWSIVVNVGLGNRRSGRFGDTIRLGRCVLGGRVGHFALVKCCTCLRGASGVRLLTFGQQLV